MPLRYRAVWMIVAVAVGGALPLAAPSSGGAPAAPRARWENGPPFGPNYFPIAVWLQNPQNAERYRRAGINLYVGLWQGPTEPQLAALRAAGMPVICEQNATGLAHRADKTIVAWMHQDEPDNAQPVTDPQTHRQTWGPPVPPPSVVAGYERMRRADPARPVLLNLGQGVANERWIGRGPGAHPEDYDTYVKGADIVSFDIYPAADAEKPEMADLWYVPKGVDRLVRLTGGRKPVWNCIECTRIGGKGKATPAQVRSEVWMALIHGSRGLIYFVHQFQPSFDEHALLDDPEMLAAVTALNRQIQELAPVINSPDVPGGATVSTSNSAAPIDAVVKRHGGATYLFAAEMRNAAAQGGFRIAGLPAHAVAQVLGESRSVPVDNGLLQDRFRPYDVHLYRIERRR